MKLLRVFPRKTNATPDGDDVVIGRGPYLFERPDEVHVSCTFTWDLQHAERLATAWAKVAPTKLGGPATGMRGEEFTPGKYLKQGYIITSRGCPNRCWFCSVWKREGRDVRTLPIAEGWNVLDDNLLACPSSHILAVFAMLKRQSKRAIFSGGLEAARLRDWHIELLADLKPAQMFFAYDTLDDYEPLVEAGKKLLKAFTRASHDLRCYVLVGYAGDTFEQAEERCRRAWIAGFFPMAMLYEPHGQPKAWKRFQRAWANPFIVASNLRTKT